MNISEQKGFVKNCIFHPRKGEEITISEWFKDTAQIDGYLIYPIDELPISMVEFLERRSNGKITNIAPKPKWWEIWKRRDRARDIDFIYAEFLKLQHMIMVVLENQGKGIYDYTSYKNASLDALKSAKQRRAI